MSGHTSESVTIRMRFVTPAFLGGANQSAELRTAPFKALLRQCWRLAIAKDFEYDHEKLRTEEGLLFGHAWLAATPTAQGEQGKTWHMKSPLSIAVRSAGKLSLMDQWPKDARIKHPEVKFLIGAHLYLGYGPLEYDKTKGTVLKSARKAIAAGAEIWLRVSGRKLADLNPGLEKVLSLLHWTGTIGGRSRNGWGSVELINMKGIDFSPSDPAHDLANLTQDYTACLERPWPHALGRDDHGLLCWRTKSDFPNWEKTIEELARIKISLRTSDYFRFPSNSTRQFSSRHFLAYPVTKHSVEAWPREARLANQLRFKVLKRGEDYLGVIYHFPAGLPSHLTKSISPKDFQKWQREAWKKVHEILDREGVRWK